jgi:hypothetical protein
MMGRFVSDQDDRIRLTKVVGRVRRFESQANSAVGAAGEFFGTSALNVDPSILDYTVLIHVVTSRSSP